MSMDSLYLAWKYILYHRIRSATLLACITLVACLPCVLQMILSASEHQLISRAASTPLIVGAKGSALGLVMSALYFGDEPVEAMDMQAFDRIRDSQLALPIPVYTRFKARGHPIVGTTLDYFDFRQLAIASGRSLAMLGECVLGADAAEQLKRGTTETRSG